ncbi:MAG: DsbA family protein [Deinococcota bacterium]
MKRHSLMTSQRVSSVWLSLVILLMSIANAQIGQDPATVVSALADFELTESDSPNTYAASSGMTIDLATRGDVLYTASAEGLLDESGIALASEFLAAASGYGTNLSEPIQQFLSQQASELAGQGELTLTVEEYLLDVTVEGDSDPYQVSLTLRLAEIPDDAFPEPVSSLGASREDATYVIREFSDFQCPFCTRFSIEVLPAIKSELLTRGDVRFEYHHFPLQSIHPNAFPAAEASECILDLAGDDAFWSFHDALFERQNAWGSLGDPSSYFVRLAEDLGIEDDASSESIEMCIDERNFAEDVREAYRAATEDLGLRGTPTVFVNGFRLTNPYEPTAISDKFALVDAFADAGSDETSGN